MTGVGLALAACSGEATTGPVFEAGLRVVITEFQGSRPVLLVGDERGNGRTRLHFDNVADSIPGNYPGLVVSDDRLLALGSPSISPDGARLAVVATVAYDQSEIVVMKIDGTSPKVASVNTQIIGAGPQWSPDGTKLAYTMSTKQNFRGIDLFVTNIVTNTVTRLTTDENLDEAAVRWSADGQSIYYTRRGVGPAVPGERANELIRINVASHASQVVATGILGQVSAIASNGARVLLTRDAATTGGSGSRSLVELTVGGTERVLLERDAAWARYLGSD
ncbi:MAG TPA: hypothetical protein VIP11_04940, partial [Gemmatimonadaceae bacterium]